jgi:hypothetical protein
MNAILDIIQEQDFSIKDLPYQIRKLLEKACLPWFNSLDFCTGFAPDPAERILIKMDSEKIYQVVFYRLIKRFGFINTIEIVGFPNIDNNQIEHLIQLHQAHLAVLDRIELQNIRSHRSITTY